MRLPCDAEKVLRHPGQAHGGTLSSARLATLASPVLPAKRESMLDKRGHGSTYPYRTQGRTNQRGPKTVIYRANLTDRRIGAVKQVKRHNLGRENAHELRASAV